MAHVPRAVCVPCQIEMRPSRNGVDLEMLLPTGKGYYKVQADEYQCPRCGHKTLVGFGEPFVHHYQPDYAKHEADMCAKFAP